MHRTEFTQIVCHFTAHTYGTHLHIRFPCIGLNAHALSDTLLLTRAKHVVTSDIPTGLYQRTDEMVEDLSRLGTTPQKL
jgi:hypothetical protein